MMTVNMRVHAIQSLEDCADGGGEGFGEGHADAGGEGGFGVDEGLCPGHEVFDVFGGGHFGGFGVPGGGVLPEVLEPEATRLVVGREGGRGGDGVGGGVLIGGFHFGT